MDVYLSLYQRTSFPFMMSSYLACCGGYIVRSRVETDLYSTFFHTHSTTPLAIHPMASPTLVTKDLLEFSLDNSHLAIATKSVLFVWSVRRQTWLEGFGERLLDVTTLAWTFQHKLITGDSTAVVKVCL